MPLTPTVFCTVGTNDGAIKIEGFATGEVQITIIHGRSASTVPMGHVLMSVADAYVLARAIQSIADHAFGTKVKK